MYLYSYFDTYVYIHTPPSVSEITHSMALCFLSYIYFSGKNGPLEAAKLKIGEMLDFLLLSGVICGTFFVTYTKREQNITDFLFSCCPKFGLPSLQLIYLGRSAELNVLVTRWPRLDIFWQAAPGERPSPLYYLVQSIERFKGTAEMSNVAYCEK